MDNQLSNLSFITPKAIIPANRRTVAIINSIHSMNEKIKNAIEYSENPEEQLEIIAQASNDITELSSMLRDTCET